MIADPLGAPLRGLFEQLAHAGELPALAGARRLEGEAGREALGTRVRFELAVRDDCIQAVRYRVYGCPWTLATCEWLAGRLEGQPAQTPAVGRPLDWAQELAIPAARLGRLLVIEDALLAALTRL